MNAAGINVSSRKSTVVVLRSFGEVVRSRFPVAKALHEAGFYVSAVNPLLINKADAMKIVRYALDNWTDLRDYILMDTIRYDLKTLNRQFQLASK